MLRREWFLNKLKDLGYDYRRHAGPVEIWMRGVARVVVATGDQLPEGYVRQQLRYCGLSDDDIDEFIRAAKA